MVKAKSESRLAGRLTTSTLTGNPGGPDTALPPEAEAYVRAAGRYCWPHRRAGVRAELAANLYQCMLDHRLTLDEDSAWRAALRDFGPPSRLLPFKLMLFNVTIYRSALAALALGAATYAAARSLGWP